ncbi:MAG: permease-like cell division protein FtsX [Sandaracinaceae bacterium]|nr:permease-like cell division protein FtsX [Sandaracinaceae bacterium]
MHSILRRVFRRLGAEARLQGVALLTLTGALIAMLIVVVFVLNMQLTTKSILRRANVAVFLKDGVSQEEITQLQTSIESVSGVRHVKYLSSAQVREAFFSNEASKDGLEGLPPEAFSPLIEIEIEEDGRSFTVQQLAEKLKRFEIVEAVESHESWQSEVRAIASIINRLAIAALGLALVGIAFFISNVMKLTLSSRKDEIEILRLCGASDGFIQAPFLIEGASYGFLASWISVTITWFLKNLADREFDRVFDFIGVRLVFLDPWMIAAFIVIVTAICTVASAFSLRRYLHV